MKQNTLLLHKAAAPSASLTLRYLLLQKRRVNYDFPGKKLTPGSERYDWSQEVVPGGCALRTRSRAFRAKVHYDDANLPVGFCALAIVAGSTVRSAILPFTRWLYPGHRHFLSSLAAPLAADENDPRNSLGLVISYRSSKHFPKPSTLCSACDSQEVSLLLFPRCTFDVASTNAGG